MTPAQDAAFGAAAGGAGIASPAMVNSAIVSIIVIFLFLWLTWVVLSIYGLWADRSIKDSEMIWYYFRGTMIVVAIIFFTV